MKKILQTVLLGLVFFGHTAAYGGVIVSPVSVLGTNLGTSFGSTTSIIDQSGLSSGFTSGVTDFDVYNPTSVTHNNLTINQWLGASPPINLPGGYIDFDLGSTMTITQLAYWMPNTINGMNNFTLLIDTVVGFGSATDLGTYNVNFATATGQVVDITDGTGQYLRFVHNSFHGNRTGMAEIAFDTSSAVAVPEPSIIALFAAGLFGIGFARRRKA